MRFRLRTLLVLFSIAGCTTAQPPRRPQSLPPSVKSVLDNGERFVLYSIEGEGDGKMESTETNFHGFRVVGKTEIQDKVQREELLSALYKGIAESDGMFAACFNPRHGISATNGNETVDLAICFECLQIIVFTTERETVLTTDSAQRPFDQALTRAGLPLAKPAH